MNKTCKKCKRPLPENYKYNCCENCRTKQIGKVKKGFKVALGCFALVGSTAIAIATKGKINLTKK